MSAIVETTAGKVEGREQDGLNVFKGIPYAAPPTGVRRWLPPEPAEAWGGVYDAKSFRPIAPQDAMDPSVMPPDWAAILDAWGAKDPQPQSEDCLYLNIWSPGLDDAQRPVFVWIHGGGFSSGSGSSPLFDGTVLSKRGDMVVVTINYRLGVLGFLNLNEITDRRIPATGNEGLLDQTAALAWVRHNIAAFGGDPNNVTIAGESAGGMSVGALLGLPMAGGLFQKAIPQSGACSTVHTLERAFRVAEIYLDILGVKEDDVDGLRALTVEQLLAAQRELMVKASGAHLSVSDMPMQPVIDGILLPFVPLRSVAMGSADGIPILTGSTLEEWKLFSILDPEAGRLDEVGLRRRFDWKMPGRAVTHIIASYKEVFEKRGVPASPADLLVAIKTDHVFRMPAVRLAEIQRKRKQPVYNYLFTWPSPMLDGRLGACHAIEQGFEFGTLDKDFTGLGPAAETLAKNMQDAWIAFARTGDPSSEGVGKCPTYGENRETIMLGEHCGIEEAPYEDERSIWDDVSDTVIGIL